MSVIYGLYLLLATILVTFSLAPSPAEPAADRLNGRWDAIVTVNGVEVPFPFEIEVDGAAATAGRPAHPVHEWPVRKRHADADLRSVRHLARGLMGRRASHR